MTAGPEGYGPLRPEDRDDAAVLARQGFGHPRDLFDRCCDLFGWDVLRGLTRDGRLAGAAAVWPVRQWFGGRPVPAQSVAMVTIDPARRGRGLGGALMAGVLEEARAGGCALSILYPATLPLYAKAGYGRAGVSLTWSAPPAALAVGLAGGPPGDGEVTRIDVADAAPLAALRQRLLASDNGLVERTEALWTFALSPGGEPADVFLLGGPGGPDGYIAVAPPKDRRLTVADACLPSRRAVRLALALLAGYRAQVDRVVWPGGADDPLALLAADAGPRIDGREEWLLRIVDVEHALTARGYPAGATATLALDVSDPLFPGNSGRFTLTVADGCGTVSRPSPVVEASAGEGPLLSLNVTGLSTLYTGHAGPERLRQTGLLKGDDAAVAAAARMFAGPSPWMPDRF